MRRTVRGLSLVLALSLAGCSKSSPPNLREWQPSDHQMPGGGADERTAPTEAAAPEEAEARAAASIYGSLCASCHGPTGRGDGRGAPPVAPPMNLLTGNVQAQSDAELARTIAEGKGGFMPAFGDRITDVGIAALVRHIRRLAGNETATDAAASAPSAGTERAPTSPTSAAAEAPPASPAAPPAPPAAPPEPGRGEPSSVEGSTAPQPQN